MTEAGAVLADVVKLCGRLWWSNIFSFSGINSSMELKETSIFVSAIVSGSAVWLLFIIWV